MGYPIADNVNPPRARRLCAHNTPKVAMTQPTEPTDPPVDKPVDTPPADPSSEDAEWEANAGKGGKSQVLAELSEHRKRAKEAEKELAKYRKAEQDRADAEKSEAEKRAAAEERATAAELRAMRLEVAHDKGLTPAQAKRLVGATREELEADADEILRDFPAAAKTPPAPKPDPSQGSKGPAQGRPTNLGQAVTAALSKK